MTWCRGVTGLTERGWLSAWKRGRSCGRTRAGLRTPYSRAPLASLASPFLAWARAAAPLALRLVLARRKLARVSFLWHGASCTGREERLQCAANCADWSRQNRTKYSRRRCYSKPGTVPSGPSPGRARAWCCVGWVARRQNSAHVDTPLLQHSVRRWRDFEQCRAIRGQGGSNIGDGAQVLVLPQVSHGPWPCPDARHS